MKQHILELDILENLEDLKAAAKTLEAVDSRIVLRMFETITDLQRRLHMMDLENAELREKVALLRPLGGIRQAALDACAKRMQGGQPEAYKNAATDIWGEIAFYGAGEYADKKEVSNA